MASKTENRLQLCGVTHCYRGAAGPALRGMEYTFAPGLYGLLGPNGSGKSTLLRTVTTSLTPTRGMVRWNGRSCLAMRRAYLRQMGYVPQQSGFYPYFTGRQMLAYLYHLKEGPAEQWEQEVERCAALFEMTAHLDQQVRTYSGGMQQRLLLAQAFLGRPQLLVLDEPSNGLDPAQRAALRRTARAAAEAGCIVLFSTHVVSDLTGIADKILLLRGGVLLDSGAPADLCQRYGGNLEDVCLHILQREAAP